MAHQRLASALTDSQGLGFLCILNTLQLMHLRNSIPLCCIVSCLTLIACIFHGGSWPIRSNGLYIQSSQQMAVELKERLYDLNVAQGRRMTRSVYRLSPSALLRWVMALWLVLCCVCLPACPLNLGSGPNASAKRLTVLVGKAVLERRCENTGLEQLKQDTVLPKVHSKQDCRQSSLICTNFSHQEHKILIFSSYSESLFFHFKTFILCEITFSKKT